MDSLAPHTLAFKPAVTDLEMALAYSGLAETALRGAIKKGSIRFKPIGPRGKLVCPTSKPDSLITHLFAADRGISRGESDVRPISGELSKTALYNKMTREKALRIASKRRDHIEACLNEVRDLSEHADEKGAENG